MKNLTLFVLLTIATSFGEIAAQESNTAKNIKAGWQKIADLKVDAKRNRDEVKVPNSDIRYTCIKVIVIGAPVNLYGLEVHYEGGNGQSISIGKSIIPGAESGVYPLESGQKDLSRIAYSYKSSAQKNHKAAHIEVWGFKTVMFGELK